MTILLFTAEELLLTTLEFRFRKKGWRLDVSKNAEQTSALIKKYLPDLVVVDLQLPDFSGLDVIQTIRREFQRDIPILATAPIEEEGLLLEAVRLGAEDFVIKPYKPDELILRIQRQLKAQKVAG